LRKEDYVKKLILSAIAIAAVLALVPAAFASGSRDDRGVMKSGRCSGGSTWKLKSKFDDGRLETEFEVDQNRVGRRWRVTLIQDGRTVFSGIRRTVAPSGSFELRRLLANTPGSDRIVARARALAGGETCNGALTI
jgi:hypothetical protein